MSSPRMLSPTPPLKGSPRREEGGETSSSKAVAAPVFSTSSQKERALVAWSPSAPTTAAAAGPGPMDDLIDPPTLEELEAMEREPNARWQEGEICETPSASEISANSKHCPPTRFSRQVSRVSGTGRAALQHAKAKGVLVPMPAGAGGAPQRGRLMHQAPLMIEQGQGGGARIQPRSNLPRRSISADDMDRRLMKSQSRAHRQDGLQRGGGGGNGVESRRSPTRGQGQPLPRQRMAAPPGEGGPTSAQGLQKGNSRNARQRGGQREAAAPRGTAASRRGAPYNAQGTPSVWKDNRTKQQHQQQQLQQQGPGRNGQGGAAPSAGNIVVPTKLRRRNSAPSMSDVAQEFETAEQQRGGGGLEPSSQAESFRGSETCWGGGLPPARNAIAQGPSAARVVAARAPSITERFPESRYPANDRESFARTLNDEELDEVWQGLGEGVSQRGCGSEVSFVAPPPGSPGTAVGAFPMLTANVLQRHDQLAVSGAGGARVAEQRPPNVMPIPKDIGDKAAHDMENGTPSSKKSGASDSVEEASLLATVVSYGMLVLWMAHLVFNALLLWPIVIEHPVWALCLVPGALGILLSFNACRKRHHQCKPPVEGEGEGSRRRHGPHPCALPVHMVLLLSVVVALGMHASALLFCEKDMQLFIAETTVEPLCSETFLLLPVILDGVMLSVASLKASSLCWAWVLS